VRVMSLEPVAFCTARGYNLLIPLPLATSLARYLSKYLNTWYLV